MRYVSFKRWNHTTTATNSVYFQCFFLFLVFLCVTIYCRLITGFAHNHLIIIRITFVIEWNRTVLFCFLHVLYMSTSFLPLVSFCELDSWHFFSVVFCLCKWIYIILLRVQFLLVIVKMCDVVTRKWQQASRVYFRFGRVCDTFQKSKHSGRHSSLWRMYTMILATGHEFNWKIAIANLKFARDRKRVRVTERLEQQQRK